jgi:hypothetical protein
MHGVGGSVDVGVNTDKYGKILVDRIYAQGLGERHNVFPDMRICVTVPQCQDSNFQASVLGH